MNRSRVAVLVAAAWLATYGCNGASAPPPPVDSGEHERTLAELRPPKRAAPGDRPVVAVLADNAGTETTDFLVPYGILAESGLVEVIAVAPEAGRVQLMPALAVLPQQTTDAFDRRHPEGADYVIVPAMHHRDTPRILDWIRHQAESGATIVGICSGAMVLAEAGVLDDRAATTHWFDIDELERDNPTVRRVDGRRYVADRGVVTTTGVSASAPVSLALVEAIGGRAAADALAERLGLRDWGAAHRSDAFGLAWQPVATGARNLLGFWSHERVGFPVAGGVDEIALAFAADAWFRTLRSSVASVAALSGEADGVATKRGLTLLPDEVGTAADFDHLIDVAEISHSVAALDRALDEIECRYGAASADLVALQLEYPTPPVGQRQPLDCGAASPRR